MFARTETAGSVQIWEAEDVWPGNGFNLRLKNSDAWSGLSCLPLYDSKLRSHKHNFLFVCLFLFVFLTSEVDFRNWFCFLCFAGFPRKLTGEISLQVFFFPPIFHERKISVCVWLSNPHSSCWHTRISRGGNRARFTAVLHSQDFRVWTKYTASNPPPTPPCAHMHRMRDKGVPFLRTAHHRLSLWAEQWPFTVGASIGRGSNPYSPEVKTEAGTCGTSSRVHLRSLAVLLQTGQPSSTRIQYS